MNYGLTRDELQSGKPIIGIAQTGNDLSPCNRHHLELAKRVRDGIRDAGGIAVRVPGSPDPGDRQAADRRAGPQPRLPGPGRGAARLPARRRRAHHRLRQDDAGLPDGGRDRRTSRRSCCPAARCSTAGSRASARAPAPSSGRRAQQLAAGEIDYDEFMDIVAVVGAVHRPLQHDGHGLDDERAGRGARHVAARLRGHPGALSRARRDGVRDRPAHRRDGARGPDAPPTS